MTNLAERNPEISNELKTGGFSVQLTNSNPFARISIVQTAEVTINKDTQTPGGTTGFNLKSATQQRHSLTAEYRSAFLWLLREIVQGNTSKEEHTELQRSRVKKDEQAVSAVWELIKG